MSQSLRPLLPATERSESVGTGSPESGGAGQRNPKRASTKAACEACRKRKSKCSAERPRCSICVERNTPCEYKTLPAETHLTAQRRLLITLQSKCDTYEALYDMLKTKQEDEVMNILQRIRAGTDFETIVKTIQEGDLLLQLSVRPEFRYRYEFPYKKDMPVFLKSSEWPNPYIGSTLYTATYKDTARDQSRDGALPSAGKIGDYTMFQVPYHAGELHDTRFVSLDVTKWTTVSANNTLLRSLLDIYFMFEYPFHPFFQKDLFIDDMLNGRRRFCSPLLVNAVLAAAWHGYHGVKSRAEHWRPENLGYRFHAEAVRLAAREQNTPKITTVQATAILNITLMSDGVDELGRSFLRGSIEMAQRLNLFSPSPESDPKWQKAAAVTAWGVFNWQALNSYHMFQPPILREPPSIELPDPEDDMTFYGEVFIRYPESKWKVDVRHGHVFRAVSGFRAILNDVALDLSNGEGRPLSPARLHYHWQRIMVWYEGLPPCLAVERIALPCHLKVHMHMYVLIIGLFELFEHHPGVLPPADLPSPAKIVAQSKASLETLVRLYFLRHGFESYDPSMILFVSLLAWSSLREYRQMLQSKSPHLDAKRSSLVLCAKFLWDQGSNCFLAEALFRLFKSSLPSKDDVLLLKEVAEVDDDATRLSYIVQEVRSSWAVGIFSTARANVEQSRLSRFIIWCGQMLEGPWQQRPQSSGLSEHAELPEIGWIRYPE